MAAAVPLVQTNTTGLRVRFAIPNAKKAAERSSSTGIASIRGCRASTIVNGVDRDPGEVTATVLMIPAIILTVLFVVQFALAYYARSVLAGAAHDGATAGARLAVAENGGGLFGVEEAVAAVTVLESSRA